jgi:hypothetical protein
VAGKLEAADLTDGKKLKTVEGGELTVKKSGDKVTIVDAGRRLDRHDRGCQSVERRDSCGRHRSNAVFITPANNRFNKASRTTGSLRFVRRHLRPALGASMIFWGYMIVGNPRINRYFRLRRQFSGLARLFGPQPSAPATHQHQPQGRSSAYASLRVHKAAKPSALKPMMCVVLGP